MRKGFVIVGAGYYGQVDALPAIGSTARPDADQNTSTPTPVLEAMPTSSPVEEGPAATPTPPLYASREEAMAALALVRGQEISNALGYDIYPELTEINGEPVLAVRITSAENFVFFASGAKWIGVVGQDGRLLFRQDLNPDERIEVDLGSLLPGQVVAIENSGGKSEIGRRVPSHQPRSSIQVGQQP